MRQEWEQETQLREELWRRQQQMVAAAAPGLSSGAGGRAGPGAAAARRPSPYRDESAAAAAQGGLAPPPGVDEGFDSRVSAMLERRAYLRAQLWATLGGEGEPAAPGVVPAFDAQVERAWADVREAHQQETQRRADAAEASAAAEGPPRSPLLGSPSRRARQTPFDADVELEMARLERELRAELNSASPQRPPPQAAAPYPQPTWQPGPGQHAHQMSQQPPLRGGHAEHQPLQHHQPPGNAQPFQQAAPSWMQSEPPRGAPQYDSHQHSSQPVSARYGQQASPGAPGPMGRGGAGEWGSGQAPATGRRGQFSSRGASSFSFG